MLEMDRYWLLTWTTYGTWLPGDERGSVGRFRDNAGRQVQHNVPGTPYDADMPRLERFAHSALKCPSVALMRQQADVIVSQFHETAGYRRWLLLAAAVMTTHVHVVAGVPGDPDPSDVLRDLKSYASRALNRRWKKPASGTWWTESGSKRKLRDEAAVLGAIRYVKEQENPLVIWTAESFQ